MNNNIDQVADIIAGREYGCYYLAARDLADAGLLVTDEAQAVLDAAVAWCRPREDADWVTLGGDEQQMQDAVDAYLATRRER